MNLSDDHSNGASRARVLNLFQLRFAAAAALITGLVWYAGPNNLLRTLASLDPAIALACALAIVIFFLLGSVNVWWLLRCRHAIRYATFLRSYAYGFSLGLLSPGQIGDVSLVLFLRNGGVPLSKSGAAYTMDKLITLSVLSLVAAFGLLRYRLLSVGHFLISVAILAGAAGVSWLLIARGRSGNRLFTAIQKIAREIEEYRFHLKTILSNVLLTGLKWLVLCASYYLAFLAFGTTTMWPDIGVIPVMSTLVGYIPVSVAGIGTVEVSAVMLFKMLGIAESVVISAYLFLRSLQYLLALGLMGFLRDNVAKGDS